MNSSVLYTRREVVGGALSLAAAVTLPESAFAHPAQATEKEPTLAPDSAFVQIKDGHLYQGDKRVRFWGFVGWVVGPAMEPMKDETRPFADRYAESRKILDAMADRIYELGFNALRLWEGPGDTTNNWKPGDGSYADFLNYYLYKLDQKGIKLWNSSLNGGVVTPDDVDIINDPTTADAWKAGVAEWMQANQNQPMNIGCGHGSLPGIATTWDPRMEAMSIRNRREKSQVRNFYKNGLRWSDDPQFYAWELTNEEMWFAGMFSGRWQSLPAFFRNSLVAGWNAFLLKKYQSDEGLRTAWLNLLPGESLAKGSVLLLPLANPISPERAFNDANPNVVAGFSNIIKQPYSRDDFNRRRGEDVIEYFTGIWLAHKKREADAVKTFGKSCRLCPTIYDSANTYQIQSAYIHQEGEVVSTCAYTSGMHHDPTAERFPFHSSLEAPPRLCWNVPWFEQSTTLGKPHFVYETQINNKTKYRAEFPLRIAAIGALQDWDAINWHIYGHGPQKWSETMFDGPINVWHDFLGYSNDEVQGSVMKVAAEIFKGGLVKPIEAPTVFIFGRKTLYDPKSMDYGRSYGDYGQMFIPTAWRHGLRVKIDPTREDDAIEGKHLTEGVYLPSPMRPTSEYEADWNRGHQVFDAPAVLSYNGFWGKRRGERYRFQHGGKAEIQAVKVVNPPNIAYPVTPEEGYVAITLVSTDGKPIEQSKKVVLSAVSTSFNTGYELDITRGSRGSAQEGALPEGAPIPEFFGPHCKNGGGVPVVVARVEADLFVPAIGGMRYTLRDWHLRSLGQGVVPKDGALHIPATKPIFIVELTRA